MLFIFLAVNVAANYLKDMVVGGISCIQVRGCVLAIIKNILVLAIQLVIC